MSAAAKVALVDDDADLRAATAQLLSLAGFAVQELPDAAAALAAVDADFAGVVLTDIRMPGRSGVELFRELRARDAELPVILMTGHGDVDTAVAALKAGAWDFLTKPFDPDALLATVGRAAATRALALENRQLRALAEATAADELVGESPAIRRVRASIPAIADAALDVMVEGASGTGKELVARLIHRSGVRGRHRFVAVDCAALPVAADRDLFDAYGILSRADRGTLFLDNLDRADASLQHRLAAFAEARVLTRAGREPEPVDVRLVAAIDEGGEGRVLPALFHRIAAVRLRLPPLAERREDVPLLVAHVLRAAAARHGRPPRPLADAAALIGRGAWPGNVRELARAAERLALGLDEAPGDAAAAPLPDRLRAFERAAIEEALVAAGGETARAIAALGIPRETFYYRAKRLGIDLKGVRDAARRPG